MIKEKQGMKWYKFVIWVQLFASTLLLLYDAYRFLTGSIQGDEQTRAMVYSFFSSLHTLDILFGVFSIVLAVLLIYVRQLLAGFKAKGPKWYVIVFCICILRSYIYVLGTSIATGISLGELIDPSAFPSTIGGLAVLFYSYKNFKDREELFTN